MLKDLWQQFGLTVINGLARSAPYERNQVAYGREPRHRMDWYRRQPGRFGPTVIFFYGGNWQSGRRRDYRFVADTLLKLGYDVVIPDYRLYPEVRFDAIRDDAQLAVNKVMEALPQDAPVFVMGHSAGAQLGALLTLDTRLLADNQRIKGFIGLAGPYDFYPFTEDEHWDLFAPEDRYPESQAVNYVRADASPLYLLHGEDDHRVRRGHSKSLMEKQQAAGGEAAREVYPGMGHVEILVEFSIFHRGKSRVVHDVGEFLARRKQEVEAEAAALAAAAAEAEAESEHLPAGEAKGPTDGQRRQGDVS